MFSNHYASLEVLGICTWDLSFLGVSWICFSSIHYTGTSYVYCKEHLTYTLFYHCSSFFYPIELKYRHRACPTYHAANLPKFRVCTSCLVLVFLALAFLLASFIHLKVFHCITSDMMYILL